jgi:uncharacterized OB-fold protein/putative sterol carrier protein
MSIHDGISVEDIFNTMKDRFRPDGAKAVDHTIGYDIRGEGKWKLTIRKGRMDLQSTDDLSGCDATLTTDGQTFVGINIGKLDPLQAAMAGRLEVDGDSDFFARTRRIFHKYVPPGHETESQQELLVLKKTISVNQRFATGPVFGKFLKGLKEQKILAIRCPVCGRLQSPPREACALCRVRNTDWVEIGPKGEMRMMEYCYYASPDPLSGETRETPYGAIGILLDGCRDEEVFWHLMRPDQLDRAQMGIVLGEKVIHGSRLRPVWNPQRTGSINDIRYFELDE